MVQAGPSVLGIVVTLLLVEGGFGTQALDRGLKLHQLCPALLPVPPLLADILGCQGVHCPWSVPRGLDLGDACPQGLILHTCMQTHTHIDIADTVMCTQSR